MVPREKAKTKRESVNVIRSELTDAQEECVKQMIETIESSAPIAVCCSRGQLVREGLALLAKSLGCKWAGDDKRGK
jgi:hypothetical protein